MMFGHGVFQKRGQELATGHGLACPRFQRFPTDVSSWQGASISVDVMISLVTPKTN